MTDKGFSSKPLSHPSQKTSALPAIIGSLGLRVLIVCLVLLVIPLFFHSFIMYHQEYRLKLREFFIELNVIAKAKKNYFEQIALSQKEQLQLLQLLIDRSPSLPLSDLFREIAKKENYESLFYLEEEVDQKFVCIAALDETLVGKKDLFSSNNLSQVLQKGYFVFSNEEDSKSEKQIFFALKQTDGPRILMLGLRASTMMETLAQLEGLPYKLNIALLTSDGKMFASSSKVDLDQMSMFSSPEKMGREIEDHRLFSLMEKHDRIGIHLPISGTSFFLLVDASEKEALASSNYFVSQGLSTLFILILLVGGGGTVWLTHRMAKPLKALAKVMEHVETGDYKARYHKDWMGFEINILGRQFNRMIDALLTHMEAAKNERVARETLARELKIGREIQKSILPKDMPKIPDLDIAAGFHPAKEVAGDFYDLFVKEDGQLMLAVADAAGKGISACLYALCVRSMLRSFDDSFSELPKVIARTNNLFCLDTGESGVFVTAWVGVYDAKSKILHYSSCGHHPAILKHKDGTIEELTTEGTALGVIAFNEVAAQTVQLSPGDTIVLFTDGLLETHDPSGHFFGKQRLLSWLNHTNGLTAKQMVDDLFKELAQFARRAPQHDDLTLLILKIC